MTRLDRLIDEQGQSPWVDNLTRPMLRDGTLGRLVASGVRGVTANPSIVAKAIASTDAYDEQFAALLATGSSVGDAYWEMALTDVSDALEILRPTYLHSHGGDGFVSIEVAPRWARDTQATIQEAREFHERIGKPNLLVKIPATREGVEAVEAMIAEGRSINVTLLFSLSRYGEILDAYVSGLERFARRGGDLASVHSVASFFVSRVDTVVDQRLEEIGTQAALALRGRAAIAQAKLAYQMFRDAHSGGRWARLARLGARVQRPLWASTSTKNPHYPDTMYVDNLIGPDTINTLPERTLQAFEDHGHLARSIDTRLVDAFGVLRALSGLGISLEEVGQSLEDQGIAAFEASLSEVLDELQARSRAHSLR
ncbi:MAG TPA: transaldolase [Nocardioidaceae bacterium]|nr:transaldolase [Nocardioidaceae bacterium]